MARHAVVRIKLRAVIGTHDFDDIVQYTANWALNSIPVASIIVAVGRNVDTQELATIHTAVKDLTTQLKAQVFLRTIINDVEQAVPGVPGVPGDPDGVEIKIFEGEVVGTGWQRTESGANFTIHMLHWLSALNNSSSVSASLHPGSPGDLTYPAVFPAIGLNTTNPSTSPLPAWVPNLSKDSVNAGSFSDIWGNILLPWMKILASDDPYDRALNGAGAKGDQDTLDALNRLNPNADGVPLELDLKGGSSAVFGDAMRTALINEIGGNWINTTLWGKLVGEWAPAYWFSVVPRVDDALIVPFTGGLRGAPWAVIGDEDYGFADLNAQLHQTLRAVGIIFPIGTSTSFDLGIELPQTSRGGLLGMYRPDGLTKGLVLMKDAPKWLSHPTLVYTLSLFAEGINGASGSPICTAVDEAGTGAPRDPGRDFNRDISELKGVASAYAHQWYVLESLKGRTGEVAGKLRFDIAPGSNVLVVAGGARNVPRAQEVTENIYATVTQVSYVINAESQKAGTAFSLAHIRSEQENTTDNTSIVKPPLYSQAWSGAKLVPAAPGPEPLE